MLDHNRSFPLDFQRSLHLSALPLLPEPTPPCSDSLKPTDPMSDVQIEATLTARAYQTEMYEKSIENNIIVVMDTGSGKTASLLIRHELARTDSSKRVWFLVPTVQLCQQQCQTLQRQIRSVEIRSFSSHDKVDVWTLQVWEATLRNVRVAVATYGVLQNALSAGFVKMDSIALIVFDEAHNCVGKSPGSKIMHDFYWRDKLAGRAVPRIMGMTASPTNKAGGIKLKKLEETLDATCQTPRLHRESLQAHANRPTVSIQYYPPSTASASGVRSPSIANMRAILAGLDIHKDPEIIRYRTENTEKSRGQMSTALKTDSTFVRDQLKTFCGRAETMAETLGPLAADFYVAKGVSMFVNSNANGFRTAASFSIFESWDFSPRAYIADLLSRVRVNRNALTDIPTIATLSPKVNCLVEILRSRHASGGSRGIVFVTERATAVVLHHLLSNHTGVKSLFGVGVVVGSSKHERGRRDLGDMQDPADQSDALAKFHSGKLSLLVATSVLEEGIDVSACNLVVCFDPPASAKSFIQRRGRARKAGSEYLILIDEGARDRGECKDWEDIEEHLRAEYEREDRESAIAQGAATREKTSDRMFIHPTTGAILDMENAKGLLQRFCAVVGGGRRFANTQPYYIFKEVEGQPPPSDIDMQPLVRAKVVLPMFVPHRLRITWSKKAWRAERNASKDAAYEAYMRLFEAKLVNDHLLPLGDRHTGIDEPLASIIEVRGQLDPWVQICKVWQQGQHEDLHRYGIVAEDVDSGRTMDFEMKMPVANLDRISPFQVCLPCAEGDSLVTVKIVFPARLAQKTASTNFIHRQHQQQIVAFNAADNIPMDHLVPQILYKVEAYLVALELQRKILPDLLGDVKPMSNINIVSLIRSALTTPARGEPDYLSLEFLGDAYLKFVTTLFLTAKYPLWPERYLGSDRARLISNTSICQAALERKIDHFILTELFDADRAARLNNGKSLRRQMARRTLAHTVKALIGAGKQSGGYETSLASTKSLFPGMIDLPSIEVGRLQLFDLAPCDMTLPSDFAMVEKLAGYTFCKKGLLVEALTHASDVASDRSAAQNAHDCYDRLSLLGNAIIETIVSDAVYEVTPEEDRTAGIMTLHRTALVNRHYLGYLAMSCHVSQTRVMESGYGGLAQRKYNVEFPLWRFLRYCSQHLDAEMSAVEARFTELRDAIAKSIESASAYPWQLLAQLRANDFLADIVESLVGATFLDSGSMDICKGVLERMGLLPYLRRIVQDKVDVVHPKDRLQILAAGRPVRYQVSREPQSATCTVHVGDGIAAKMEGSVDVSEEEAHIRVALAAIEAFTKPSVSK